MSCGTTPPAVAPPPPADAPPVATPPVVVTEPPPPAFDPNDPRDVARHALRLHDQKKWDEAIFALRAAVEKNPKIAPYLLLRMAAAEEARGNAENAAFRLTDVINLGDSAAATVATIRLPAQHVSAGNVPGAEEAFRQAMAVPIDELTEEEFVELARDLASFQRADLAQQVRMRLLTDYTSGRFTEQTYGHLSAELDALPLEASLRLAQKLAGANRYDQALDLLGRIARRFPDAQTQDLYRATRIRALFNSRNYTTLLSETEGVALNDAALQLLRARAAWRAEQPEAMLTMLAALEEQFPTSKEAAEAKVIRAKYYVTDVTDYAQSIANLEAAIAAGALGNDGENLWNLGFTYVLWGKDDDALRTFDRYIRSYPDGDYKTNSLFWSAKVLDKLGRTAERDAKARQVIAEYPYSYYAYRTKELWNVNAEPAALATNVFPDVEAELAKITDPRLELVRELTSLGLHRDASREMKVVAAQYADNAGVQFLLADTYVVGGEPFKANTTLQRRFRTFIRHGGTNIPRRFWEILYPLAYFDVVKAEAEKRGTDPYLVASIIRQESAFEPTTVSNAGAVGLMQIMPAEAERLGGAAGIPGVTRETLFDPAQNIAIGVTEYLLKLQRMQNQPKLAIAAYNAGETAVDRWLARTPIDDIDLFIEQIPFAETKLYVKTVTRNREEYRRIYQ